MEGLLINCCDQLAQGPLQAGGVSVGAGKENLAAQLEGGWHASPGYCLHAGGRLCVQELCSHLSVPMGKVWIFLYAQHLAQCLALCGHQRYPPRLNRQEDVLT